MYLLDTNHCSRVIRGDQNVIDHIASLGDAQVATCVIVRGEMFFMAQKSQRKDANLTRIELFLQDLFTYPADAETADTYGSLKASIFSYFGPNEQAAQRRTRIETLGFSENDIWIAAIALRYKLILVSADSDFIRMQKVMPFPLENWLLADR